jgi:transposase InsO family protein
MMVVMGRPSGAGFVRWGIRDRPISPRSPWQNPYTERLIGTLRRDCLDDVLIFGVKHLRRILASHSRYYNETRTHLCRFCRGCIIDMQHSRRELVWLGVTARPSAHWIARQLTEAYGWQQPPRYIVRDRDCVYGAVVIQRFRAMGIRDRPISPRSPWQNGYSERLIGSIRRECLDHVVVFSERHLRHLLNSYQKYYNEARTHLSLHKDAPIPRAVQTIGRTLAVPVLGGLHHQYFRA